MNNEEAIKTILTHVEHWHRLLRDKICDETEGKETIEAFLMAIEALEQNQWVSCESITEPIDREVLCCDKYGNELIGWLEYSDFGECWVCDSDECVMYDTVAYMDLPKPYEGETK